MLPSGAQHETGDARRRKEKVKNTSNKLLFLNKIIYLNRSNSMHHLLQHDDVDVCATAKLLKNPKWLLEKWVRIYDLNFCEKELNCTANRATNAIQFVADRWRETENAHWRRLSAYYYCFFFVSTITNGLQDRTVQVYCNFLHFVHCISVGELNRCAIRAWLASWLFVLRTFNAINVQNVKRPTNYRDALFIFIL